MKTKTNISTFDPRAFLHTQSKRLVWSVIVTCGILAPVAPTALADRATLDDTRTRAALLMETAPTIDGVIEQTEWNRAGGGAEYWQVYPDANLEDGIRGGVLGLGEVPADNDDLSIAIWTGFDADYLYVAVRVRDSSAQSDSAEADSANGNTWEDDSVEVFVDADNANADRWAADQTGGQYVITVNNAYRENEAGNPGYGESAAWFAKTSKTDTGYDAEFRISLGTLGNPKAGDVLGFTIAINDDDDGAARERQVLWMGTAHQPVTYGNLLLGTKSYTAPKTASAPQVDGKINSAEYAGDQEITVNPVNGLFYIPLSDDAIDPTDLNYKAWVVHDADAIYVAVDVTDEKVVTDSAEAGSEDMSTWDDDSVELFFDADNSKDLGKGTAGFEGQHVLTANGAWRDNEANNPTFGAANDWFAATTQTATGYQIEFKVKKAGLSNPADGSSIGFHIAVNDDDNGPESHLGWTGHAHQEFTYGTLTLGTAAPPAGNLTVKGVKINADKLELTITTSNPSGAHAVQQSSNISPAQWTNVAGVTFADAAGGEVVASFPRPSSSPTFYRVIIP
ncbi:MAG: hypothetical protein L0Z50_28715 [Verrucomicrobiales bacterium]|nr:hypothetical protein [Verrucomicrobiales bacterium]